MSWFKRSEKGIQTKTEEKKDIPKGLWYKTPTGKIVDTQELASNFMYLLRTIITFTSGVRNILRFYLTITTLKSWTTK